MIVSGYLVSRVMLLESGRPSDVIYRGILGSLGTFVKVYGEGC